MAAYDPTYPSKLEHALDFEHLGFREFMASKNNGPDDFLRFSEAMAGSDNPIVQYAAGSAAAERALYRPQPSNGSHTLTLSERRSALELAQECWTAADQGIDGYRDSQPDHVRRGYAISNGIRIRRNLAYLPLMEVGAALLAREPLAAAETASRRALAQTRALEVGRTILDMPAALAPRSRRRRLAAETLCGLIVNADHSGRYAAIPTPLRKHSGNESIGAMGVGYFALCTYPPYRKTPMVIFCQKPERPCNDQKSLAIVAPQDFARPPKYSLECVLRMFITSQDQQLTGQPRRVVTDLITTTRERLDRFNNRINVKFMHQRFGQPHAIGSEATN